MARPSVEDIKLQIELIPCKAADQAAWHASLNALAKLLKNEIEIIEEEEKELVKQ